MTCSYNAILFFQAEDGIRDYKVTGVQTCALPISGQPVSCGLRAALRPGRSARRCRWRSACRRSEEHTSELQSPCNLVCRLLLEKKKTKLPTSAPSLTNLLLYSNKDLTCLVLVTIS